MVVGTGKIQGERLDIEITSLEYDGTIIPIIALTANAFWEDAERVKREGMNEHLPKPLDVGKMLSVLAKYRK